MTEEDPGTVTQWLGLVFKPLLSELVCACKIQPVWSTGHEMVSTLPLTLVVTLGGFGLTVTVTFKSIVLLAVSSTRLALAEPGGIVPKVKLL